MPDDSRPRRVAAGTPQEVARQLGLPPPTPGASWAAVAAVGAGVVPGYDDLVFDLPAVRVAGGVLAEAKVPLTPDEWQAVAKHALRLTFELVPIEPTRAVLVYGGGWPFDLTTHDPSACVGRHVSKVGPRGAGDEVMRDLMESASTDLGGGRTVWPWGGGRLPQWGKVRPAGVVAGGGVESVGLARLIGWEWEQDWQEGSSGG